MDILNSIQTAKDPECSICRISIHPQKSDVTRLACGHSYHSHCAHMFMTRQYGYCVDCLKERKLLSILSDEDYKDLAGPPAPALIVAKQAGAIPAALVDAHPIDWGDDKRQANLLRQRLCLIKIVSNSGAPISKHTAINDDATTIDPNDFNSFLNAKEMATQQQQQASSPHNGGGKTSLMSKATALFSKTIQFQGNASDVWMKLDADPIQLLYHKVPMVEIVEQHGITSKYLIDRGIQVEALFQNEYNLQDLILLGTTWSDLLSMYFSAEVWIKHKAKIPVSILCKHANITIADVISSVCRGVMLDFIRIGFTCDELVQLKASANILCHFGLVKEHMLMMGYSMQDWHSKLGLQEHTMIKLLDIKPSFLFLKPKNNTLGTVAINPHQHQRGLGWLSTNLNSTTHLSHFTRLFPNYCSFVNISTPSELLLYGLE